MPETQPRPASRRPRPLSTTELRVGPTRLGEWLVRRGLITRVELFLALDASYRHCCRLGDALVWLEILSRGLVELEVARFDGHRSRRRGLSLTPTRDTNTA
jgi:hypothetical protein